MALTGTRARFPLRFQRSGSIPPISTDPPGFPWNPGVFLCLDWVSGGRGHVWDTAGYRTLYDW
nr:MAG TPA: hypothetical protein [Caudoviricetes sp.]